MLHQKRAYLRFLRLLLRFLRVVFLRLLFLRLQQRFLRPLRPPRVLAFTPGPLVAVGEGLTALDAFFVRFLAELLRDWNMPERPDAGADELADEFISALSQK